MKVSEQSRADAISMIKWAKLCLLITLFVAGVFAIWTPFYPKFLMVAVVMGILAGGISWYGWTLRYPQLFRVLSGLIPIMGVLISREILVPSKLSYWSGKFVLLQSISVMFSAEMVIILLGVVWFKKEVADVFTPAQPPNLPD